MAGMLQDDDDEITGINVTPLVDVMLVLLIIFMVTTSYIVHKSIEVKLPKAETATDSTPNKNLAFVVDKDSQLYLDGAPIAWADVAAKISQAKASSQGSNQMLQALITADELTPHGLVVKLIDTVRKNGITDFAINVDAVPSEQSSHSVAPDDPSHEGKTP